jgi:hypothetical protein
MSDAPLNRKFDSVKVSGSGPSMSRKFDPVPASSTTGKVEPTSSSTSPGMDKKFEPAAKPEPTSPMAKKIEPIPVPDVEPTSPMAKKVDPLPAPEPTEFRFDVSTEVTTRGFIERATINGEEAEFIRNDRGQTSRIVMGDDTYIVNRTANGSLESLTKDVT